mmetsp:Transcript_48362/g.113617  ORF Transcript_48362/g.113617 Transcript_48362/m.113617 type:complete len:83 (-) Transcript_48362:12-260(-)
MEASISSWRTCALADQEEILLLRRQVEALGGVTDIEMLKSASESNPLDPDTVFQGTVKRYGADKMPGTAANYAGEAQRGARL